jgi:hypothetical protein
MTVLKVCLGTPMNPIRAAWLLPRHTRALVQHLGLAFPLKVLVYLGMDREVTCDPKKERAL